MEIEVAKLRKMTNDLLLRLEQDGTRTVELSSDYYWNILPEQMYDSHDEPHQFTMGQLSEDLEFVNQMIDGTRPPVTYGLVWISSLLRFIGEKIID
jgi:hypothetical protein